MKGNYIPFLAFLSLILLTAFSSFNGATSVIPGWHTTIFPPYFILSVVLICALLLATVGYWLLARRVDKISWVLFCAHFILTMPAFVFLTYPTVFMDMDQQNQTSIFSEISFRLKLIPLAWILFGLGQLLFMVYYFRIVYNRLE